MSLIRILHASDLHISVHPGVTSFTDYISAGMYWEALTRGAAVSTYNADTLTGFSEFVYADYVDNFQNKQAAPVDAVILTGDIATTGLNGDLQLAFNTMDGPAMRWDPLRWAPDNPTLAGSTGANKIPLWLMPGNHDRLRPHWATWYAPGDILFDDIFKSYWGPCDPTTRIGPRVREFDEVSRAGLTVKLFAADFTLKDARDRGGWPPYYQYAQGRVYPEILHELIDRTVQARARTADPLAILWAVHFPPRFPGISDAMRLVNEEYLLRAAADCEVDGILSGHTHEPVRYRSMGAPCDVFCSGTTTQDHAPLGNHFQILNIEDTPDGIKITPEDFIFDPYTVQFVEA